MPTWSDLLPEILNIIAGKLDFYEDFINFLCVCTSWKNSSTTKKNIHPLPSRYPLLMFAESQTNDKQDHRMFFLFSNGGTTRKLPLPEARRQRCLSTHGWLLTTGEQEFQAKLIHPLSRTQINLPKLYMFEELYFDQDEWVYYVFCMRKVVFTSSLININPLLLSQDPLFHVIIIWGKTIAFCKLGDVSWTRITGFEGHPLDITYHSTRKRLFLAAKTGTIYESDIFNRDVNFSRVSAFQGKELGFSSAYLVEWGYDGLLMVIRKRVKFKKNDSEYERYGSYRTCGFECFVLNLEDGKWSKVESLGEKALFVGLNSSFVVDYCGGGVIKEDCVYFMDDLYEPYRDLPDGGGGDVGIYHMFDGKIEGIFSTSQEDSLVFRCMPPLWLQTSVL